MADSFSLDSSPAALADVPGFKTGAAACGLKKSGNDVGILYCERNECVGTATFAASGLRSAAVRVSSPRALSGKLRGVVVTAGNANCLDGDAGMRDAREIVDRAALAIGIGQESMLVASCGAAGAPLPMDRLRAGIASASAAAKSSGAGDFASAVAHETLGSVRVSARGQIDGKPFVIAGVAKVGSPALPDMAKMFAFVATDVVVSPACLREIMIGITAKSFGLLALDNGAGPADTFCVLASCAAGNEALDNVFSAGTFAEALEEVAARLVVGAATAPGTAGLAEIRVKGAASETEAEAIVRSIGDSNSIKVALASGDSGWPLILAAAGRASRKVDEEKAVVRVGGSAVFQRGAVTAPAGGAAGSLAAKPIVIELELGLGSGAAAGWAQLLPVGDTGSLERAEKAVADAKASFEKSTADARVSGDKADREVASLRKELGERDAALKTRDAEIAKLKADLAAAAAAAASSAPAKADAGEAPAASGETEKIVAECRRVTLRMEKTEVELEQAKAQLSLKEQLVKQLLEEQKPKKKSKK